MSIVHHASPDEHEQAQAEQQAERQAHKAAQGRGDAPPDIVREPKSKLSRGDLD